MEGRPKKSHCTAELNDEADIVVIGASMIETIIYASDIPRVGETVNGFNVLERFSGKGANQCVAAAKLGASVALISKLGDDKRGTRYLEELERYPSINTKYIWSLQDVPTGVYATTISNDIRQSVVIPGANAYLSIADVETARNLLLQAKVVLFQGETPWETTLYCLQKLLVSSGSRAKVIVNPSPAVYPLNPVVMILADILCMNELEAGVITGMEIRNEQDLIICMEKLIAMKCNTVIITLGESGVVYASKESPRLKTVSIDRVDRPQEVDGAGDCFVGALGYFLCYFPQLPIEELIVRSCQVARLSLFHVGLQNSFPEKEMLNEKVVSSDDICLSTGF